jgi:hypothetical protein
MSGPKKRPCRTCPRLVACHRSARRCGKCSGKRLPKEREPWVGGRHRS